MMVPAYPLIAPELVFPPADGEFNVLGVRHVHFVERWGAAEVVIGAF
jgi:hypothetical protein